MRQLFVVGVLAVMCPRLVHAQLQGMPERQASEVIEAIRKAGAAGSSKAQFGVLLPMAEKGNAAAQYYIAEAYDDGNGVLQDLEAAARWWRRAAGQGLALAQNNLGIALTNGYGVDIDHMEALHWFRKAAEQGLSVAQVNIGVAYWEGKGVEKDSGEAVSWFRKAADQGLGWGQMFMGVAYANGRGVSRDDAQANEWFLKAAEQGYMNAQKALGVRYLRGLGFEQDSGQAVHWLAMAARQGDEEAIKELKSSLRDLRSRRVREPLAIRQAADAAAPVLIWARPPQRVHELGRSQGWVELYLADGHLVGYAEIAQLERQR